MRAKVRAEMKIENQTLVISGASSGIGAEIAKLFATQGYDILLLGRDEVKLTQVQTECRKLNENTAQQKSNQKIDFLAFDLAAIHHYTDALKQKLASLSPPTVLINNAGLFHRGSLEETSDAVWNSQFQINLLSAVHLTQILWPFFKNNKKGAIVNISSTLGLKPTADTGAYSAIKAALINWTQSLAQEGGPHNIRANCICPGIVDTPLHPFHHLDADSKKRTLDQLSKYQLLSEIGKPQDIAEAAYFLASDRSRWTTGSILNVDGGIHIK